MAASSRWVSNALSWRRTLQAMRASLLARATASLFLCNRSDAVLSHAPKLNRDQVVRPHQQDLRGLDQQGAQIFAAAFGNAAEDRPPAGAVLTRHEAEPGGKIATAFKRLAAADRRNHGSRGQRPDSGNTPQALAFGLGPAELFNLAGDGLDALIEAAPVSIEAED